MAGKHLATMAYLADMKASRVELKEGKVDQIDSIAVRDSPEEAGCRSLRYRLVEGLRGIEWGTGADTQVVVAEDITFAGVIDAN